MSAAVAEILRKARARIEDPERHCTRKFAFDSAGREVPPRDPTACRWCALGAIYPEIGPDPGQIEDARRARLALLHASDGRIVEINDGPRGHRRVLEIYGVAIAAEESVP